MNIEFHYDMKITDDIFKSIFNESVWISITISLKFVPKGPIDYKSALVQVNKKYNYSRPRTWPQRGFPERTLSVKASLLAT